MCSITPTVMLGVAKAVFLITIGNLYPVVKNLMLV